MCCLRNHIQSVLVKSACPELPILLTYLAIFFSSITMDNCVLAKLKKKKKKKKTTYDNV